MITTDSRYAAATVAPVTDASGVTRLTIIPPEPADETFIVQYYTWAEHDRIDTVAFRFYHSERLWWLFARANPEILDWSSVKSGTVIRIPSVA